MTRSVFFLSLIFHLVTALAATESRSLRISTGQSEWILRIGNDGRLRHCYLGAPLTLAGPDIERLPPLGEIYPSAGGGDFFEPALFVTHADGNPGTVLTVESTSAKAISGGTETTVSLRDKVYPLSVTLHLQAYEKENVFKVWSEISHREKRPITLSRYASVLLPFRHEAYYLTQFSSDWAREVQITSQPLRAGKKILDSNLGSRAAMFMQPFFRLEFGSPATENTGNVLLGTLNWTGNFSFTFEIDNQGTLRLLPAINSYASNYTLAAGSTFTTPAFVFTLSDRGAGPASRNLHRWARRYGLCRGEDNRLTLLNNWENTYFNFNTEKLGRLMHEARELGVDLFLLDDGWFGNKYPRSNDRAGLGDWQATRAKLPGGLPALLDSARAAGVKFGLWIEPEMVNPASELFEKHRNWVILQPNREPYYYRNQLVLDLSNPQVQDFVFSTVENILKENPGIAYLKWDCNSPITNVYSPYLGGSRQGNLYIDYVRGLYSVVSRLRAAHPDVYLMLCSGGGGRCDYGALQYFTEFWCSDNTDPVERLYIQWGFSQLFPAKAMCAHVTDWNTRAPVKFRTDVAFMCKLGFDINFSRLKEAERTFCTAAVKTYNTLKPVILDGDLYRLVSPYGSNHMAVMYVAEGQKKAVLFGYDINPRYGEPLLPVRLEGLRPGARYRLDEVNLMPGSKSRFALNGQTVSGQYLMNAGVQLFTTGSMQSRVIVITEV